MTDAQFHNISLDFDGVIHQYLSPWTKGDEIHDPPVEGAFDFIRAAVKAGYGVHVLSARANDPEAEGAMIRWFHKHGLEFYYIDRLNISPLKKGALVYIDDRGWRFEGTFPRLEDIARLEQWNKRVEK